MDAEYDNETFRRLLLIKILYLTKNIYKQNKNNNKNTFDLGHNLFINEKPELFNK